MTQRSRAIRPLVRPCAARPRISTSRLVSGQSAGDPAARVRGRWTTLPCTISRRSVPNAEGWRAFETTASAPASNAADTRSSSMSSVSSRHLGLRRHLARLLQTRQGIRGVLHVRDEDDVGAQGDQRHPSAGIAAVDEPAISETGGLPERHSDRVDDQRVIGHDENALHVTSSLWVTGMDDMDQAASGSAGRRLGRRTDEPVDVRVVARLRAVGDAELPVDVREVELDRLLRHPQLTRDHGRSRRRSATSRGSRAPAESACPWSPLRRRQRRRLVKAWWIVAGPDLAHQQAERGRAARSSRSRRARRRAPRRRATAASGSDGQRDDLRAGARAADLGDAVRRRTPTRSSRRRSRRRAAPRRSAAPQARRPST